MSATKVDAGENNCTLPARACRPCSCDAFVLSSSKHTTATSSAAAMPDPTTNTRRLGCGPCPPTARQMLPDRVKLGSGRFVVAIRARSARDCGEPAGGRPPDACTERLADIVLMEEKSIGDASSEPSALAALRRASARWNASRCAAVGTVGWRGRGPFALLGLPGGLAAVGFEVVVEAVGLGAAWLGVLLG